MEDWKEYKLGDVLTIKYGKDHKQIADGDIPIYGSGGIMRYGELSLYDGPSILIPRKGSLNNIMFANNPFWTVDTMFWTIINEDIANPLFVYYSICKKDLASLNVGSAVPSLTVPVIEDIGILLPSKETQNRIVAILKSLDDKIEVNRRINDNFYFAFFEVMLIWALTTLRNDNLEQQAQALFKSWFVDFEPFKDGDFVESELGMIPKGWRVGNIYEYIDVIYGAPYKSTLFNDNKNGLPLIRIRDLKTNAPQFYTPEVLPNTEYINAGDIVAGMDAEFIPYVWLGEKGVLNQRCCKFKGKNEAISNYYILFLIKPELEYVQSYKTGTTVSHLGKSDIDRFRFITPPLDVVLYFSGQINSMKEEVVSRAKESRRLASLRDTLLPKLMSGELKLNEVNM